MRLDHVFICCDEGAPEAAALQKIGLVEGSRNTHPGQGTENRRFFFEVGFIELFWVSNPAEAQSERTAPTRFWPRWRDRRAGACPFGIVLTATEEPVEQPPFESWPYQAQFFNQPVYFAAGTEISEPEIVYLPWRTDWASVTQPKKHAAPLRQMKSVAIGLPNGGNLSNAARKLSAAGIASFHSSAAYEMAIHFLASQRCRFDLRPTLPLILDGAPDN